MSEHTAIRLLLVLLILTLAAVLTLDRQRRDELDSLAGRLDGLDGRGPGAAARVATPPAEPAAASVPEPPPEPFVPEPFVPAAPAPSAEPHPLLDSVRQAHMGTHEPEQQA